MRTAPPATPEINFVVRGTVAGYAVPDSADDPTASVLAELGVAPLRVSPAPDAAELVLLAHARRVHDNVGWFKVP